MYTVRGGGMQMVEVNVKDARSQLSELLDRVERGEEPQTVSGRAKDERETHERNGLQGPGRGTGLMSYLESPRRAKRPPRQSSSLSPSITAEGTLKTACFSSREKRRKRESLDPGDILPGSCVHGNLDPLLDKGWDTEGISCFEGHGLAVACHGVPFGPRI